MIKCFRFAFALLFALLAPAILDAAETLDMPRLTSSVAVPSEQEARDGLPDDTAPILRRTGQGIRRKAMLQRRIALAFIEKRKAVPEASEVEEEVARFRAMPVEEMFGCCSEGTFDDHLRQLYMNADDFRESVAVELGLRRAAQAEWDALFLAVPAKKKARVAELDNVYFENVRRVWSLPFTPSSPDETPEALLRRAEAAAKRLAKGEAWEAVARDADCVRDGLPVDGDLGLVPIWQPLVTDAVVEWRDLPPSVASAPWKALGGGFVILKWRHLDEDDLAQLAREEDVGTWVEQWNQAASQEAAKSLEKTATNR